MTHGSNASDLAVVAGIPRLMDIGEVQRLLGVRSRSTMQTFIKRGRLRALKVGGQLRFRPEDVDAFVRASALDAAGAA